MLKTKQQLTGFILSSLLLSCSITTNAQAQVKAITVDCDSVSGSFRGLYDGVNAGPYSYQWGTDLSPACDEVGLTWFRNNDLAGGVDPGPGDIPQIYGNTNIGDVTDPANYDFSEADIWVAEVIDGGYNVFYRLGRSWGYPSLEASTDPTRWAEVAHHIIMHFNEGWDNGYYYNIQYWEIFGEPDNSHCWSGTRDEWFAFFDTVFTTLKGYYPDLKIGGCGFEGVDWRITFCEYCAANNLNPDFISWHIYNSASPNAWYGNGVAWRSIMDENGLTGESIMSEWGMFGGGGPQPVNANAKGAAFYAAALTYMQDSPIDRAFRYRLDGIAGAEPNDGGFSMINSDLTLKIPTCSFKAFKCLYEDTPVRINAEGSDTSTGYAVIAGKSIDGQLVQMIIGDWNSQYVSYDLIIENLPWGTATYTYERYTINDSLRLKLVESEEQSGASAFQTIKEITVPEVHLIKLYTSSSSVEEDAPTNSPLRIYPNPTNGIFTIKGKNIQTVDITNING